MTSAPSVLSSRTGLQLVSRVHLNELLSSHPNAALVLIVAPAGFGKTSSIEAWVEQSDRPVAWLSLGEAHNDPSQMLASLLNAVVDVDPSRSEVGSELLQGSSSWTSNAAIEGVASAFVGDPLPIVVIDDLHVVRERPALEVFERWKDALDPGVRLIIMSRHDPSLPLARSRVAGRMLEVRASDLRFTTDEVSELGSVLGVTLSPEDAEAAGVATEGWAAALALAMQKAKRTGDPRRVVGEVAHVDTDLASFLVEEVMDELSDEDRRFVLHTSVVDGFTADLARHLTGDPSADERISRLASEGLLVRDADNRDFGYHSLIREFILTRLASEAPDVVHGLHRSAAAWHHEHGSPELAVRHALRAGDVEDATDWLADASSSMMRHGRASTLLELSRELLDRSQNPNLLQWVIRIEALHGTGADPQEFDAVFEEIIDLLGEQPDSEPSLGLDGSNPRAWSTRADLPWARAARARVRGEASRLVAEGIHTPSPSGWLEGEVGEGLLWMQRYNDALRHIDVNAERAESAGYPVTIVHCLGMRALARLEMGEIDEGRSLADRALSIAREGHFLDIRHAMYARLATALAEWTQGDLSASEAALLEMEDYADTAEDVPILVQHSLVRARVRASLGDTEGARSVLVAATTTRRGRVIGGHFGERLLIARAWLDLNEGDTYDAERWFGGDLLQQARSIRHELLLRRLGFVSGLERERAFQSWPEHLESTPRSQLEAHLIAAEALHHQSNPSEAAEEHERARLTGERYSMSQIVADASVVREQRAAASDRSTDPVETADGDPASLPVYIEPLTAREYDVLRLMPTHLTYPEIADQLYISASTVRSHAKSIFQKLAVTKRSLAVSRARQFGLLD